MLLSRIVTCYRQWSFIAPWIRDPALHDPEIQWIILNDCPEDPCPPDLLAASVERGVEIVERSHNVGRSNLRNAGVGMARGVWVDNVDGDDLPLPMNLDRLREVTADVCYFGFRTHSLEGGQIIPRDPSEFIVSDYHPIIYPEHDLKYQMPVNLLYRKSVFAQLSGYDARYEANEDNHLLWKAYRAGCRLESIAGAKQSYCLHDEDAKAEAYYSAVGRIKFCELLLQHHPEHADRIHLVLERHLARHLVASASFTKRTMLRNQGPECRPIRDGLRTFAPLSRDICLLSEVLPFKARLKLALAYLVGRR